MRRIMTSHCFTRRWIQPQNKARGHRSHGVRDPEGAPKMGSHGLFIQRVRGRQDIDDLANVFAKLLRLPSNLRSLKICKKISSILFKNELKTPKFIDQQKRERLSGSSLRYLWKKSISDRFFDPGYIVAS